MRAVICPELGGPEVLRLAEMPVPEPGPGEVRIRVEAATVNFPDVLIIQGLYQFKPEPPFIPGGEGAGVVDAVGEGVTEFSVGDRVAGLTRWGGFAEYVVVSAASTFKLPDAMDFATGAALGTAYGTSYHALVQRAEIKAGDTVLVLGAAGGVGLSAVEIAKALGARVIAAASTEVKRALTLAHGADHAIDYRTGDLKGTVKELTGGKGVDIIYDPVGGAVAEPALRSIAWGGRYLVIGFASGAIPSLPINLALIKSASIVGTFWGVWSEREPVTNRQNFERLMEMFAAGSIRPHIDRIYSMEEAGAAVKRLMDGEALGKVVIDVRGET